MSACRSRALIVCAALTALAVPALAQVGPPVRLLPREPQNAPQAAPAAPAAPSGAAAAKSDAGGIQIGQLGAVDPSGAGIVDESNGGLPAALWTGTPRTLVVALVPKLAPSTSPALQSLARRLLASAATVPEGAAEGSSLLALRVAALDRLGLARDAAALAQAVPSQLADPAFQRAALDAYWLAGQTKLGCGKLNAIATAARDEAWSKANAFCRAEAGDHDGAGISAGLLRDQNVNDVPFFALFGVINGESDIKLDSLPNPPPLTLAMLQASDKPVPADVLKGAPPATAAAVAGMGNAAPAVRVPAAERAAAYGGISPEALGKLYAAQSFPPEDLAKAPSLAPSNRDGLGNALLYQAARNEKVPAAAAEAIAAAFALRRESKAAPPPFWLMRVYGPLVFKVAPAPEVVWFAGDAARACLAAGDLNNARAWASLGDTDRVLAAPAQAGQSTGAGLLARLMALADKDAVPDAAALATWYGQAEATDGPERDARTALFYTLLEALGTPVAAERWQALTGATTMPGATVPAPAILHGVGAAASAGKLGETALYALLAFGEAGPAAADAATLSAVVAALKKVGLEADARAIAVEAAMAHGL